MVAQQIKCMYELYVYMHRLYIAYRPIERVTVTAQSVVDLFECLFQVQVQVKNLVVPPLL